MKQVVVLGSTGSIGTQALAVLTAYKACFRVVGLSAYRNMSLLARQIQAAEPDSVAVPDLERAQILREELHRLNYRRSLSILTSEQALSELATADDVDTLIVGLVGFCGLAPTLAALEKGIQVLTANKETFVTAGHLVHPYLKQIIPLDSEHSAIYQCLQGQGSSKSIQKLYLTASGGPFRNWPLSRMATALPSEALEHPNWTMGAKVTVDSATMMNKGLEMIEAQSLFNVPLNRIDVVVHPQSIVHSAVAFCDGSVMAQMGQPDMRVPIQYGLTYPNRWAASDDSLHLDLTTLGRLDFEPADVSRFPALSLARSVSKLGGTALVVLNAADEIAVQAYLDGQIQFGEIIPAIERMIERHDTYWHDSPTLEAIIEADAWTRREMKVQSKMPAFVASP